MSPIQTKRQECIVYSRVVGWLTPLEIIILAKLQNIRIEKL
jgi:hypothetical protein